MKFVPTPLKEAFIIEISPITDSRGWFARVFCKDEFKVIDNSIEWVQFNNSFTYKKGTIRGMHFQVNPFSETKLVRCISGSIFDVIIDLREGSDTFLKWFGTELSAENRKMMFVPKGFAHGFQTLKNDCEVLYAHTSIYKPGYEGAIRYNDPMVNIRWPLPLTEISEKDNNHQFLNKNFTGININ